MSDISGADNNWKNPPPDQIRKLLQTAGTVTVVGLSSRPGRPGNRVARYLQSQGYRIIPINPNIPEALGEKSYPDLHSVLEAIDIVDVFRRPSAMVMDRCIFKEHCRLVAS